MQVVRSEDWRVAGGAELPLRRFLILELSQILSLPFQDRSYFVAVNFWEIRFNFLHVLLMAFSLSSNTIFLLIFHVFEPTLKLLPFL
jgi:hypothetical protein